jgi:hypothetical protein
MWKKHIVLELKSRIHPKEEKIKIASSNGKSYQ